MSGHRVAYLMTHYPLYSQTFLADEVAAVRAAGCDVVTIALNRPAEGDLRSERDEREAEATVYLKTARRTELLRAVWTAMRRSPRRALGALWRAVRLGAGDPKALLWQVFYWVEACALHAELDRWECRHVHAQFGGPTAMISLLATALSPPGELTWSFTVHGYHEFTDEARLRLGDKVASAAFVVAVSDHTRSQLMRNSDPGQWDKIVTVRCGIDLERFPFLGEEPRESTDGVATMLTVGRLSAEKGQMVLVDAMAELCRRGVDDVRLQLLGDGPLRDELQARVDSLGLQDVVEFLGGQPPERVRSALEAADVFCLPSFAEGVPVSIMEACAVGVPVVASAVGGIPELVLRNGGRTVVPGSAERLADALAEVLSPDFPRRDVVKAARATVEQLHDLRRVGPEMARRFDHAISGAAT